MAKEIILSGKFFDGTQRDIDKIIREANKQLMKIGVSPLEVKKERSWGEEKTIGTPAPRMIRAWRIAIAGTIPAPKGMVIHGTIETIKGADKPYIKNFSRGRKIPFDQWRNSPPDCCECGRSSGRGEALIVTKDEGDPAAIGKDCLAKTLGFNPDKALKIISIYGSLDRSLNAIKGEKGLTSKISDDTNLSLVEFMQHTLCIIDKKGYVSAQDGAMPTGQAAMIAYLNGPQIAFSGPMFQSLWGAYDKYTDEFNDNKSKAMDMILWAKRLPDNSENTYLKNIKKIAEDGWVSIKHCNLASSIYHAYESQKYDSHKGISSNALDSKPEGREKTALHLRCARIDKVNTKYGERYLHKLYGKNGSGYGIFFKEKSMTPGKFYNIIGVNSGGASAPSGKLSILSQIERIEASTIDGPSPLLNEDHNEDVSPS